MKYVIKAGAWLEENDDGVTLSLEPYVQPSAVGRVSVKLTPEEVDSLITMLRRYRATGAAHRG